MSICRELELFDPADHNFEKQAQKFKLANAIQNDKRQSVFLYASLEFDKMAYQPTKWTISPFLPLKRCFQWDDGEVGQESKLM